MRLRDASRVVSPAWLAGFVHVKQQQVECGSELRPRGGCDVGGELERQRVAGRTHQAPGKRRIVHILVAGRRGEYGGEGG